MTLNQNQFQRALSIGTRATATGMLATGVAISNMTHEAPKLWPDATAEKVQETMDWRNDPRRANIPRWNESLSRQFEGFRAEAKRPQDALATHAIAVREHDGQAVKMPYTRAWNRNTNDNGADDVFVVGSNWSPS